MRRRADLSTDEQWFTRSVLGRGQAFHQLVEEGRFWTRVKTIPMWNTFDVAVEHASLTVVPSHLGQLLANKAQGGCVRLRRIALIES